MTPEKADCDYLVGAKCYLTKSKYRVQVSVPKNQIILNTSNTMTPEEDPRNKTEEVNCDYLVVGAGLAGMSFVDTLLTESKSATVIIVDRNAGPGGHWTTAYPFVKLHQPSCFYGVNSLPLGKHRNCKGKEKYDIYDRATGAEVVEYFEEVCENFKKTGRVKCFFGAEYQFDKDKDAHTIIYESKSISVTCGKLVTVKTNVNVPSMRKEPIIPVDKSVNFVPVNEVPSSVKSGKYKNYIVFGNGKTGTDAVVELLKNGVDQSQIKWIVSRDVWYILRDGSKDFYKGFSPMSNAMLEAKSLKDFYLGAEKWNLVGRLDPIGPFPEVFKGPGIDYAELCMIQKIQNVVRMGRATSVESGKVLLQKGNLDFTTDDTLLVDCMAVDFYGIELFSENFTVFEPGKINLGPFYGFFNASFTYAVTAFLECKLDDDASKNNCCFFLRGKKYSKPNPASMIGMMYLANKSNAELARVKGGAKFMLTSRTNMACISHHKGGLLRLLWFLFGPEQGIKFEKKLEKKVESKGFSDLDHCFGAETFGAKES